MATLETLRMLNPDLTIHSVQDKPFSSYGRVLSYDAQSLIALAREKIPMPKQGVDYRMACEELEAHPAFTMIKNQWFGEGNVQLGICLGYNSRLDALEYHRASEFNVAVTDMLLLLAMRQSMNGDYLDTKAVEAFFVPQGTCIEVYATSMHYCPIQTQPEGFISLIILPKGTNGELKNKARSSGENALLFAVDKWLICHGDCKELVAQGAFEGLRGDNIQVKYEGAKVLP